MKYFISFEISFVLRVKYDRLNKCINLYSRLRISSIPISPSIDHISQAINVVRVLVDRKGICLYEKWKRGFSTLKEPHVVRPFQNWASLNKYATLTMNYTA